MFKSNVSLASFSNYRIGGPARYFFDAKNVDDIQEAISEYRSHISRKTGRQNLSRIFILGGGTNILFDDRGFDGLVLQPNLNYIRSTVFQYERATARSRSKHSARVEIMVGAGTPISELLNYSITNSLSGLEWAGGLPGTLGGAIRGNAGCFGGETKDVIQSVNVLELQTANGKLRTYASKECQFGYRTSVFKEPTPPSNWHPVIPRYIILEATLALGKGDKRSIRKAIEEKIAYRNSRHPMEYPNVGSIFKNVPVSQIKHRSRARADANILKNAPIKNDPFPIIPTAHLISEAGLKGVSCGGAMVSPKHPNFIVNVQSARSEDIKKLIGLVKGGVKNKFGIELEEEIQVV